jgi:hypothetical protein
MEDNNSKFTKVLDAFIASPNSQIEIGCKNSFERMIVHNLSEERGLYYKRHTSSHFTENRERRVKRYCEEHISFCNYGRGCRICKDREWHTLHRIPIDAVLVSKVPIELSRKDKIHQKRKKIDMSLFELLFIRMKSRLGTPKA